MATINVRIVNVRIVDAIDYFTWRIADLREKAQANRAEYEAMRKEYEKGLRFRFFKTPFEKTDDGKLWGMFDERWDFVAFERWIKEAEGILLQLRYHQKLGETLTSWHWADWRIAKFYAWCAENDRPC